ncbi:MAG: response regulator [Alphaproteobacteria bacterium]|nr:response regulator [Alphaproteobacteria bacterium]
MPSLSDAAFAGLKVLIVEDSYLIARQLSDLLAGHGCEVIGPVGRLAAGMAMVEKGTPLDGAVLDVNLNGELCFPIAICLARRKVPFVFLTGYEGKVIVPRDFDGVRLLTKPLDTQQLIEVIATDFVRH